MRADVVVVGPRPTTAYIKLARLVVRDITDMSALGHYVQALALQVIFAQSSSHCLSGNTLDMSHALTSFIAAFCC